ncbi:MAG TPA: hypothetical protein VFU47_07070 [Armatimonadota bacterium]|nr:hypothetical protein [Armatimonadota bacterium]
MTALAQMDDAEFDFRMELLRKGRERIERIHRELMCPEADYGKIPGTGDKPTLLQPGAEKLCQFYRLVPSFDVDVQYGDGETRPPITAVVRCRLHQGTQDGPVVGEGIGACTSWEKKYRYRRGERACPACGAVGTVIKGKAEFGGGWICFAKKGGCGAKFPDDAPEIVGQVVGDVENPDPYELLNTIVKMGKKRAHIDATKSTTATSALYTQDVEDMDLGQRESPARGQAHGQRGQAHGQAHGPANGHSRPAAAAEAGEKCPKCHAPAGKPHARRCPEAPEPAVPAAPPDDPDDPFLNE